MKLYITGSPGTGKTTISIALQKELNKQSFIEIFEIRNILEENHLLEEYEKERDTNLFDLDKAMNFIQDLLSNKESFILVGPPLPFNNLDFSSIIVLTCSKKNLLIKRLSKRNYMKKKIDENIDAEFASVTLGYIMDWISENKVKSSLEIVDTCKNDILDNIQVIISLLRGQK